MITTLDWFLNLNSIFLKLTSREGKNVKLASSSEIRRWFKNKAIILNGIVINRDEDMNIFYIKNISKDLKEIESLILFPKSKNKVSIW